MSKFEHEAPWRGCWTLLQRGGIGLLVAALVMVGLVVSAGATVPASGDTISTAAQPVQPSTAGIPFASGQSIDVVIPANSAFAGSFSNINIIECAAPNGTIPTLPSACDGSTVQGSTILPNADGSFTYTGYQLFALPDSVTLGEASGGPACGKTAATECILYIGNNQLDFTAPHLWSAPFFIAPNATDSGTPAGDGSPPATATLPDAAKSTAVASPLTATANGVEQSTVTVSLLDATSLPVAGKTVSLAVSCSSPPCTAEVTGPSPAQADTNGQISFTVTDTVAEAVTLTATDTSDTPTVTVSQKPVVTFQAPAVSAAHSTVAANPTSVGASSATTITVTLRDQAANPQPVAGHAVTLSGTGSAVITPAATPNTTDAHGVATFTATDAAAETVTFTATDTTASTVISGTAQVTFGTLVVSASKSTVTVSSPAPVGAAGTEAVVTLLTSSGSPVAGKALSLQTSPGSVVVGASSPATTGADGKATFKLTDSVAESTTLTATDTTDGIQLTSQPTVTFATGSPSATVSTVVAAASTSPADGETQTLINVTVKDQFGNPQSGKSVTLQGAPSGNIQMHPIAVGSTQPGVTNGSGIAQFEASDSLAETVIITATDTTDNLVLSKTVSIAYQAGPADPAALGTTVIADPTNPPADGSTSSTITVTLTDYFSNPVAGKTIALKALNGSSTVSADSVTNEAGQATFSVTDSKQEIVAYQATDVTDGNAVIEAQAVVTFGNPPAPPPVAAYCSVVANPSSVTADGTHTATVSVLLYDGNGDPVSGKTVTLTAAGGASKVTATNATSDNSGLATFAVTDATPESVKYTAHDSSDGIDLTALTVTVTFTAASSSTTTTTTTTTTIPASTAGAATSAVTSGGGSSPYIGPTGNSGATYGTTTASLASTGAPTMLPWLVGVGAAFLGVGTVGRRRINRRESNEV